MEHEPWRDGWLDRHAVWGAVGTSNHVLDGGPDPPVVRGNFGGFPPPFKSQGLYRPWQVLKFSCSEFQAWKVLEKGIGPGKPWKSPGILKQISWGQIHRDCLKIYLKTSRKIILRQRLRCPKTILRHVVSQFTKVVLGHRKCFDLTTRYHGNYDLRLFT